MAVAALMTITVIYVILAAIRRIGADVEIATGPMIIVTEVELIMNVICVFLLREGASQSINVRAAYQEVLVDAVGSVGVLIGGIIIVYTDAVWVDTLIAFLIGAFIAPRAFRIGRDALRVLSQAAPVEVDVTQEIGRASCR